MKKRIVYVWDADYPWDVRTEKTCLALQQAGHDVHIVARNKKWSPVTETLPEGTVHRMRPWHVFGKSLDGLLGFPAFFNPRWKQLLAETVRETHADLIIARDIPLCPTAISVGKDYGIPVILDMAENYPAMMRAIWETGRDTWVDTIVRNPKVVERVERWCISRVHHIVVVVEESGARVERLGVPANRITVVSNTPPKSRIGTSTAATTREVVVHDSLDVVYMGNMEVARGLLESIDAVALLRQRGQHVRLRLIGKGRDDQLIRAHAASRGLGAEYVEFLGYIESHDEALAIVAASDIGLLPHRKCEAWDTTIPNKLFDYMAAGLPVVSSNADPCARILAETGAGVVFRSEDADDLAASLLQMTDPSARAQRGSAGQRAITERYHWEHDARVFLDVVETAPARMRMPTDV